MEQRVAITYAWFPSHTLNLGRIPGRLAERGWKVFSLHRYAETAAPMPLDPGVDHFFDVPMEVLSQLSSDLYLTPFVGQAINFPAGARRIHFLVSLAGLDGVYDDHHFDHWDAIVCAGRHQVEEFAAFGASRGWGHSKAFLPVGYPKLDGHLRELAASQVEPKGDVPTVVFAPTHAYVVNEAHSILRDHGPDLVARVLASGARLIFRPHPNSWTDQDAPVVAAILAEHGDHPLFEVDRSGNYFETYARADLMVTDVSGTGFTFAFTFGRPAIYLAPNVEAETGRRGIQFESRDRIGYVARSIDEVVACIQTAHRQRDEWAEQIRQFRDSLLFNVGSSESVFVEFANGLCSPNPIRNAKEEDDE